MSSRRLFWLVVLVAFVALKAPTLVDPPYGDATFYSNQLRVLEEHGLRLADYQGHAELRPPLFLAATALVRLATGPSRVTNHAMVLLAAIAFLVAAHGIARRLGAAERWARWTVVACALSPLFFAQAGLFLTDLPVAAWVAWAWLAALEGRMVRFAVLGSLAVLTKESAWFICLPAALLAWRGGVPSVWARLGRLAWALAPGGVLALWLVAHRLLTGETVAKLHQVMLGRQFLAEALLHAFVDGDRVVLWPLALVALAGGAGARDPAIVRARRVTALAAASFALCFPAPLPRYVLPTLPMVAPLAAIGLERLAAARPRLALAAMIAIPLLFVVEWRYLDRGDNGGTLDATLKYRLLLDAEREAARALADAGARSILAHFPMASVVEAPPEDGFLPAPLGMEWTGELTTAYLCRHDFFVEMVAGVDTGPSRAALEKLGALTPWRTFGGPEPQLEVRVSRIACPRP
jgi:hypothetical protein